MQMLGTWLVAFQDIRPGGGRNPIGRRTESDRAADGIRSDGVMPSRRCFQGVHPLKKALKNRNKKPPDMW